MSETRTVGHICGSGRLHCLSGGASVIEAARMMRQYDVGAVMVTEGQRLDGILTERDVAYRVVAEGLDPMATAVRDVMTTDVMTARPSMSATQALQLMAENRMRHLPVVEADGVVGIVSVRDFLGSELAKVQEEISFEGTIAEELW
jgi:CBS domain-containing protein